MTTPGKPVQVKRTIKERLFTRPWRPFTTHRTVVPQLPSNEIVVDSINQVIYVHPVRARQLQQQLGRRSPVEIAPVRFDAKIRSPRSFVGLMNV